VVEGEEFPMEDGDLITTPAWSWHDFFNRGDEPVYWLDGLDIPLIRLAHVFREIYPQDQQSIEKPLGYSANILGPAKPLGLKQELAAPPFRYPWRQTYAALMALKESAEPDPCDGFRFTYVHPLTGGPTTPTFSAEIQLLPPGMETSAHRHNSTTRYHVVRGAGATVVEGERLEWGEKDVFLVPPWCWHQHESVTGDDVILFSVTDQPMMETFEFYREEVRG
jgi:gentisate 1,2-dioxygenase